MTHSPNGASPESLGVPQDEHVKKPTENEHVGETCKEPKPPSTEEVLRRALEPFARLGAELWNPTRADDRVCLSDDCGTLAEQYDLKVSDFFRAREALSSVPCLERPE